MALTTTQELLQLVHIVLTDWSV